MNFTEETEYENEIKHLRERVRHLEEVLRDAEDRIEWYRDALYDVRHTVSVVL